MVRCARCGGEWAPVRRPRNGGRSRRRRVERRHGPTGPGSWTPAHEPGAEQPTGSLPAMTAMDRLAASAATQPPTASSLLGCCTVSSCVAACNRDCHLAGCRLFALAAERSDLVGRTSCQPRPPRRASLRTATTGICDRIIDGISAKRGCNRPKKTPVKARNARKRAICLAIASGQNRHNICTILARSHANG